MKFFNRTLIFLALHTLSIKASIPALNAIAATSAVLRSPYYMNPLYHSIKPNFLAPYAVNDAFICKLSELLRILNRHLCADGMKCDNMSISEATMTKLASISTASTTESKKAFIQHIKFNSTAVIRILGELEAMQFHTFGSSENSLLIQLKSIFRRMFTTIDSPDNFAKDIGELSLALSSYLRIRTSPCLSPFNDIHY